jgi:hypothetical protein
MELGLGSGYTAKVKYGSYEVEATSFSLPTVTANFPDGIPVGEHNARVAFEKDGKVIYSSGFLNTVELSATVSSPVDCSWSGG